jgi:hypothetical protein
MRLSQSPKEANPSMSLLTQFVATSTGKPLAHRDENHIRRSSIVEGSSAYTAVEVAMTSL